MTPLQLAYLNKLRATAELNLSFFRSHMPHHALLLSESPIATVDISDLGDLTVRYADGTTKSVPQNIFETEKRLLAFEDLNDRPQILAFHKLRQVVENPSHGDLQLLHYSKLDAEFPNRVSTHFAKHYPDNCHLTRYPYFGDKEIPLLIVFGSGLGWHLPRLITQYRIRHLVVIETDIDAFRLSTFFQDYVLLSKLASENGTDLAFIVQSEVEKISRSLTATMLKSHGLPQFFIHGAALYYAVEDEEKVSEIRKTIVETLWELFFGMGYFDDELITVRHTFENLNQKFPIFMQPQTIKENAVAFIVGSGPSLDDLIPIIKEYGDRAVIFSCGTAISILYKMGIQPDFHVEKERPSVIEEVLIKSVDGDLNYLKDIIFVGLNTVCSGVFKLFSRAGMIVKKADTMGSVLELAGMPNQLMLSGQPTVSNTAIEFALAVGFNRIYLFGVDMGSKVKEIHHSKHTVYVDLMPEEDQLKKFLTLQPDNDIVVQGNFGGQAHTNKLLAMANRMLGVAASNYGGARVFNLNDGAKIEYTLPLKPEALGSTWSDGIDKQNAIERAWSAFRLMPFEQKTIRELLFNNLDEFTSKVKIIVSSPREKFSDVIDQMIQIHDLTYSPVHANDPCALLFRGTFSRLLSMTYNACSIINDKDEILAKAEWDFMNLIDFLEAARYELEKNAVSDIASAT